MSGYQCYPGKICFIKQKSCKPRNAVILSAYQATPCEPCQPTVCRTPVISAPCAPPPCPVLITPRYGDFGSDATEINISNGYATAVFTTLVNGPTNANPLLTANSTSGCINIPFPGRYLATYSANIVQTPEDGKTPVTTAPVNDPITAFLSNGIAAFPGSVAPINFGTQTDTTTALMGSVNNTSIVDFTEVAPSAPGMLWLMFDVSVDPASTSGKPAIPAPYPIKLTLQGPLHTTTAAATPVVCQPTCATIGFSSC